MDEQPTQTRLASFSLLLLAVTVATIRVALGADLAILVLATALILIAARLTWITRRIRTSSYTRKIARRDAKTSDPTKGLAPIDDEQPYGQMGSRMRRSLQLRDDESAVFELIAADSDRGVVLRAITQLLSNQFRDCRFRIVNPELRLNEQAHRVWPVVDPTDFDVGWELQAVMPDPDRALDPDVLAIARDLARLALDKARSRSSLRYMADHDALTGLLSRRAVLEALDVAIASGRPVGIVYGDVDHFKGINDRLGHLAGDDLLVAIARRICESAEAAEFGVLVGRLGGDEYLCVLCDCSEHEMDRFASGLAFSMQAPFALESGTLTSNLSWGASFNGDSGSSSSDLLREADVALYQVKRGGRNAYRRFDASLRAWQVARSELQSDLAISISKRSGIHANFQPQFDADGELVGFEALGRWWRQGVGPVPPDEFIPVAVERGLMADFDHEMFAQVTQSLGALRRDGRSFGTVSINVSAERLERADFVDATLNALRSAALDPSTVVLEITESSLLRDLAERGRRLGELRRWGVRIAIDDFGTGYSSLSYLRTLPVDIVKLDKEFVSDIDSSEESQAIVKAILALAKAMNLKVVAEGVERQAQFDLLREYNCDIFQGFLLGRPLEFEAAKTLAAGRWLPSAFAASSYEWPDSPPDLVVPVDATLSSARPTANLQPPAIIEPAEEYRSFS